MHISVQIKHFNWLAAILEVRNPLCCLARSAAVVPGQQQPVGGRWLQTPITVRKAAVSCWISEKSSVGFVCSEGRLHRWHQNSPEHLHSYTGGSGRGRGAGVGFGVSWRVRCCSRHIVNSINHPINPAAGKTKHKTYDRLMMAVLQRPNESRSGVGGDPLGLPARRVPACTGADTRPQSQGVNCRCLKSTCR